MQNTVTCASEFFIPQEGVVYRTTKGDYFCRMGATLDWDLEKFVKVVGTVTTRELFSVATIEYLPQHGDYDATHTVLRAFENATNMEDHLRRALTMYEQDMHIDIYPSENLEQCFLLRLCKPLKNGCNRAALVFGSTESAIIFSEMVKAMRLFYEQATIGNSIMPVVMIPLPMIEIPEGEQDNDEDSWHSLDQDSFDFEDESVE